MRIKLKNFRCYKDKTFEFEDSGLFLISGISGQGKSTILMSINFALYGNLQKVIKHGETSCYVEFEFGDMKILRTKKPNRLVVNDVYEDDVAQNIINEKFGTCFETTGYIKQNATDSFILMSPTDKLKFLESFAFNNVDLNEIKQRCKSVISQRNDEYIKTMGQLESARNFLKDMKELEPTEFPLKKEKNREIAIKNENTRYINCQKRIKRLTENTKKIQNELNDLRVLNTFLQSKDENLDSLIEKLENLTMQETDILYIGDEQLNDLKLRLNKVLSMKKLIDLEKELENNSETLRKSKKIELENYHINLENITKELWKEYSKEEVVDTIASFKDNLKDLKQISFLNKQKPFTNVELLTEKKIELDESIQLLEVKKDIYETLKKQKISYICPSCNEKLCFQEERLCKIESNGLQIPEIDIKTVKKDIDNLQIKIKSLEKFVSSEQNKIDQLEKILTEISEIKSQYDEELDEASLHHNLEQMEFYNKKHTAYEDEKNTLECNIRENKFSSTCVILENNVKNLQQKILKLQSICGENIEPLSEEELREIIKVEQSNKDNLERLELYKKSVEIEKEKYSKQIEEYKARYLEKYEEIRYESMLIENIRENESELKKFEEDSKTHLENLELVKQYEKYVEDKKKYDSWLTKIEDLELKEKEDSSKYSAAKILRYNIAEAESISMINIIESINAHANIYLEGFFLDNPISVNLRPFKQVVSKKSDKPQINVEVFYKENECDLNSLSGGETARIILAFVLALNEMFSIPVLLLDEILASLDESTTNIVINCIKEHYKGKVILFICHQTIEGSFDHVLHLENDF
jgi:exonuclease SbcC